MNKLIVTLGIIIMLSGAVLGFFMKDVVVGEHLCVDGKNNINLDGFMCEKTEWMLFDFTRNESAIIVISLMIVGTIIYFSGLSMDAKGRKHDG